MGSTGSDFKPLYTVKDILKGKQGPDEEGIKKLIEEDLELFKRRAERTREELPKFTKAMKKKIRAVRQTNGTIGRYE
jgi:hypothetical protein